MVSVLGKGVWMVASGTKSCLNHLRLLKEARVNPSKCDTVFCSNMNLQNVQPKLWMLMIIFYNSVDNQASLILLDRQWHGKDSTINTFATLTYAPEADTFSCSSYPFFRGCSVIQGYFLLNFESARVYRQAYELMYNWCIKLYFMALHISVWCCEVW